MLALLYQPERGRARGYTNRDYTNVINTITDTLDTAWFFISLDDTLCNVSCAARSEEKS